MGNRMVNLRLNDQMLREIDLVVKGGLFNNRTEFIKQSIRSELSNYNKEQLIKSLQKKLGQGKRSGMKEPSQQEWEKIRKYVWEKLHEK